MFRPRTLIWLLGLSLLVGTAAGAGWILNHSESRETPPPSHDTTLLEGVIAFGHAGVDPGIAKLYPLQHGRVVWLAEEGKKVRKGDVVLRLDSRLAEADLKRAKSDRDNVRLQLRGLPERLHRGVGNADYPQPLAFEKITRSLEEQPVVVHDKDP